MRLERLAAALHKKAERGDTTEITHLACNIEDVRPGTLFFCITGGAVDRHDLAAEAERAGAAAFVAERELETGLPLILVKNARAAMAKCAKQFYGNRIDDMKLVTVTGTNGKTTTTYILDSILRAAGKRTAVIGTCGVAVGGEQLATNMTTPDPIELHRIFAELAERGVEYVVMEVSAHAVYWKKMEGTVAEVAVFTNLTQDHLDFFRTMARYKRAKLSYFDPKYCRAAVVNADDAAGGEIVAQGKVPCVTYGCESGADVTAINFENSVAGIEYVLQLFDEVRNIRFAIPGRFNMYNTMAAAAAAKLLGIDSDTIAQGIRDLTQVAGRFNILRIPAGPAVVVDYAHTPDGLENLLQSAREICRGKLVAVFGCGGNRDKKKRPMMGEIASRLCDLAVVTSDNPRYEAPLDIMADIVKGMDPAAHYVAIESREEAIRYALEFGGEGDLVVIAGKGHEDYQEICGEKHGFSDAEVVARLAATVRREGSVEA